MKKILPIIFILLAFTSCSNDDDKANPVIGSWKLVKTRNHVFATAEDPNKETITDYLDKNIVYTFDGMSNLTININGQKEQHQYEYKLDYLSGGPTVGESKIQLVIIDGSKWTYSVSPQGEMILGKSYVDGSDLFFVKQ
ncbi:hypothetical protein EYY60_14320 [Flavobacterium zhairuonense]|uniref:hypothetical protein n=1 Tax=Flavobacterium zhairuonense TaxID=2493631 RepID=UPI001050EA38|nr:hypothetical protein [Flavobacterium zhairuonense]KAF2509547.1 hypothetical protein EYY60_14320 [Flavobacterium zhairuonense]